MWNRWTCWLAAVLLISACSQGTLTRVVRTDGTSVVGELVAARPDAVVVKIADGSSITIPRSTIRSIESAPANAAAPSTSSPVASGPTSPPAGGNAASSSTPRGGNTASTGGTASTNNSTPTVGGGASSAANASDGGSGAIAREAIAPSGTLLELTLNTPIGSDTSAIDDKVDAVLRTALIVNGTQILSAGTTARGIVTEATPSTRAAGRGRLGVRFETIQLGTKSLPIQAAPIHWEAPGLTKRPEPESRNFFKKAISKTKKGLRIGDDDRERGSADVRFATGAIVRIRLEQAARLAP